MNQETVDVVKYFPQEGKYTIDYKSISYKERVLFAEGFILKDYWIKI